MTADWCAIDFGTSNSAIAWPARPDAVELVPVEAGQPTMPTAVFYRSDGAALADPACEFGRAAMAAYVDGLDGRLMRSMKSVLGSSLIDASTDIGAGRSVRYADVISRYLLHLAATAERHIGYAPRHVVLGRPVRFVDDDDERDAAAQGALEAAARRAGFDEVHFRFEPIAAALDHERQATDEHLVLVADIGGGTSDFSVVRVGPHRRERADRRDDILANHGVHVAGTDFDRHISLDCLMPLLGHRSLTPARPGAAAREVPSGTYHDLATWHLINTVYAPQRVAEMRRSRAGYADTRLHRRLMTVLDHRLGHALAAAAEHAKIHAAQQGLAIVELDDVEGGLTAQLDEAAAAEAIEADCARIEQAARETVRRAGIAPDGVQAVYFTGGSTGLRPLVQRIEACFPAARSIQGDRFASVAQGLGEAGRRLFNAPAGRGRAR